MRRRTRQLPGLIATALVAAALLVPARGWAQSPEAAEVIQTLIDMWDAIEHGDVVRRTRTSTRERPMRCGA
jgi:hypothetical protein